MPAEADGLISRRAMARLRQALRVVLVAVTCASATAPAPAVRADAGSPRTIVIISDLHLGVGKDPATGSWHAFEDFRWAPEFARFLAAVNEAGSGRTDLVLNGDTFELWQSLRDDCTVADVGCSEADARRRIDHVIAQHRDEMDALAGFARAGENTVTIIPGNHDAALLFPAVAAAVVDALAVPAPRVRVEPRGSWSSPDGLVYAEHGHQIGHEVNRFEGWPTPFVERGGQRFLRRPWGEQFVQAFYNDFERRYPIIDNITDERGAIRLGTEAEGRLQTVVHSAEFLKFFLLDVSSAQLGQALGGATAREPVWDVAAVRAQGNRFIVESFPVGDPLRPAVAAAASAGALPLSAAQLTTEEIRMICDHRARLAARSRADARGSDKPTRCPTIPRESLGATVQYLLKARDDVFGAHLRRAQAALAAREPSFRIFVYSHTHIADPGFAPLRRARTGWDPWVINTGAWQRVIGSETIARDSPNAAAALSRELESLPACYSMVWVDPYATVPAARLRSWRRHADGTWGFGERCPG